MKAGQGRSFGELIRRMDVSSLNFEVSSLTHPGKVRERNEDSCLVRTDAGFWVVADGMGGHEAGDMASQILVESLNAIERPEAALDLLEQCEAQISRANQRILDLSRTRNGATIGTTAALLLVRDQHYACLWAGDSRIYLIKGGTISRLSRDHTEVEELVVAGALSREDAENWPNNVITRAVGVAEELELEIVTGPADPGDTFVLCSDGLTKHLRDNEILEYAGGRNTQAACELMLDLALERGGLDNVTVVVVRLLSAPRSSEPTKSPVADGRPEWRP